eukprot:scaffold672_cov214-Chaetoceros_neogracile.AAC.2
MMAEHIRKRLEDPCADQDIVASDRNENLKSVDWDLFLSDLNKAASQNEKRAILEQPLDRKVNVKKDQPSEGKSQNAAHRSYNIEDTLLQSALRRCPPEEVLNELTQLSPAYLYSKQLYDIINTISMDDDEWTEIKRLVYRLCISKIYSLSEEEIKNVFRIRHGWREDTLLMLAARRNPPLKIIEAMLTACRECIAIVDTALYDWIPVIYAIAYGASHDVIAAMIPDEDDFASLQSLKEYNFLEWADVYNRTPLHWTVFYGASIETVIFLKDKTSSKALDMRDDHDKRPFEMAINEGTSMDVVEALLPDSMNFDAVEMNIIRSVIHKKVKTRTHGSDSHGDGFHDNKEAGFLDNEEEFADMKRYDVSSKVIPYLAKALQKKQLLQNIMIAKSCQTVPIFFLMLDFYSCVFLILSFRNSTIYYMASDVDSTELTPWLMVLTATISYMTFRELFELYLGGVSWFFDLWNLCDATTIAFVVWCIVKMITKDFGDSYPAMSVAATALIWFNALAFLRATFLRFSIFVSGLITIIQDLMPFLIVTFVLLMGFGEMYNIDSLASGECRNPTSDFDIRGLAKTNDGGLEFCTFGDSLFSTYALFVGGIEMADLASTTTMKMISIAFGFFVAVILLNVVIAIVSNSWDSVADEGKEVFWNYRLLFFNDIKNYEEMLPCLDGGEILCVSRITNAMDGCVDSICKLLWVRQDYW